MIKDLLGTIEKKESWSRLVLQNMPFFTYDTKRALVIEAECLISEYNRDCKIFIRRVDLALRKYQDEQNMPIELQKIIKKQYTELTRQKI